MWGVNALFVYGDAPRADGDQLLRVRDAIARRGPGHQELCARLQGVFRARSDIATPAWPVPAQD